MAFKKDLYKKNLKHTGDVLGQLEGYGSYANKEMRTNEMQAFPVHLAKYIHENIDAAAYTDQEIQNILQKEGPEKLAEHAKNDLETYLFDDNCEIQAGVVPGFKDSVAESQLPGLSYHILSDLIKAMKIDVSGKVPKGLEDYVTLTTSDEGSDAYKKASEKVLDAYVEEIIKDCNLKDEAKERRKWFLKGHYKETGTAAVDEAIEVIAATNKDKIAEMNKVYADEILKIKDNKQKLAAVVGYESTYDQKMQELMQRKALLGR